MAVDRGQVENRVEEVLRAQLRTLDVAPAAKWEFAQDFLDRRFPALLTVAKQPRDQLDVEDPTAQPGLLEEGGDFVVGAEELGAALVS